MFVLGIKLAHWPQSQRMHIYKFKTENELVNWLHSHLGSNWYEDFFEDSKSDFKSGTTATGFEYKKNGNTVQISSETHQGNIYDAEKFDSQKFAASLANKHKSKISYRDGLREFFRQMLNPLKWMRHGLTLGFLAMLVGAGFALWAPLLLSQAIPVLITIVSLGVPLGLGALVIYGVVATVFEYQDTKKKVEKLRTQTDSTVITSTEATPEISFKTYENVYSFSTYLHDLFTKWPRKHPIQAGIVFTGLVLFVAALILTIPYCIDPMGSFSFMSFVFSPMIHFLHEGLALLIGLPHLEFLKCLQTPAIELAIAAGLFISGTLSVALTLKGLMQGADDIREGAYNYNADAHSAEWSTENSAAFSMSISHQGGNFDKIIQQHQVLFTVPISGEKQQYVSAVQQAQYEAENNQELAMG